MDDKEVVEKIYNSLKRIESSNEYRDIESDIKKIDYILKNEIIIDKGIYKDKNQIYNELLTKYNRKADWNCCGYDAYHKICYRLTYINNTGSVNVNINLYNLRRWIIRYWMYKFSNDRLKDVCEELFIRENNSIKDIQNLEYRMFELDNMAYMIIKKYLGE